MSGCVAIDEHTSWSPSGWAYRATLDEICDVLTTSGVDPELLHLLADENGLPRLIEVFDLSEFTPARRESFARAAQRAYERARERGPVDWRDPSFFPGFLMQFGDLLSKLGLICPPSSGSHAA